MSQEKISELRITLDNIERRMRPLEWDLKQNQINEYRKVKLTSLREEHASLFKELQELQQ